MGKSIWDTRFGKRGVAQDDDWIPSWSRVEEGDSWKTIHGAHVLLGDDGRIKAGAGNKFTGMRLEGFGRPDEHRKKQHERQMLSFYNSGESTEEASEAVLDYTKQYEQKNPPKVLKEPMSEADAIARIAGGDKTGGSCASASLAFIANQELGLDVRDFRGGVSQLAASLNTRSALEEIEDIWADPPYDEETDGGGIFEAQGGNIRESIKALDNMQVNKNYIAILGGHQAVTRKLASGEVQYLELQGTDREGSEIQRNGWHTIMKPVNEYASKNERNKEASTVLQNRFRVKANNRYRSELNGVVPAERYAQTHFVKDYLPYVNTSESKQMKGSGGGIK